MSSGSSYGDSDGEGASASSHESYDVYSHDDSTDSDSSSEDGTINLKVAKSFMKLS